MCIWSVVRVARVHVPPSDNNAEIVDPMNAQMFVHLLVTFAFFSALSSTASEDQTNDRQAVEATNMVNKHFSTSEISTLPFTLPLELVYKSNLRSFNVNRTKIEVKNTTRNLNKIYPKIKSTFEVIMEYKARKRRNPVSADKRKRSTHSIDKTLQKIDSPVHRSFWSESATYRTRRQANDDCESFTKHEMTHQIFNPGYPGDFYLPKMDCVTTINTTAGKIIKLDFLEKFELEDHPNCTNDYLEIRDGAYGFSDRLGQFCGSNFPRMVKSKGPHLWLRFHSDATIEYSGFRAFYEFEDNSASKQQPASCVYTIEGLFDGQIGRSDINESCTEEYYRDNLPVDALWHIKVEDGWRIFLNFTHFQLQQPNECKSNFVDVFADKTELPKRLKNFCGSVAETITSETNSLFIRFYATPSARESNFTAYFTAFRKQDGKSCEEDEFDCDDATCIKYVLRCDKRANCRLKGDEDPTMCNPETESILEHPHIVIILVIFSLILSGMVMVFIYKCVMKIIEDHKTIQEQIRQSREDRLENLMGSKASLHPMKMEHRSARSSRDNITNHNIQEKVLERSPSPEETRWSREIKSRSSSRKTLRSSRSPPKSTPETCEVSVCAPDVKESGCQTRESLFALEPIRCTDRVSPRPEALTTFRPPSIAPQLTIQIIPTDDYRKMTPTPPIMSHRPLSNETTRSAPDVIIVANSSP